MPFINGRYVPDEHPEAVEQKKEREQRKQEAQRQRQEALERKEQAKKARREKAGKGKTEPMPELTPEELELLERQRQREIEESAARFEELIKNDTPDLTNLNKLIESERKKVKSPFNKNKRGITFFLTVALIACLFLLIASISFASATLLVISLISIAVFIAIYFLAVPRGK